MCKHQKGSLPDKVFREDSRIVIEKSGIPVAAIISAEDLKRFDQLEQERVERFRILDEVKAAFRDIPDTEIEKGADQALARVRQTMRTKTHDPGNA